MFNNNSHVLTVYIWIMNFTNPKLGVFFYILSTNSVSLVRNQKLEKWGVAITITECLGVLTGNSRSGRERHRRT